MNKLRCDSHWNKLTPEQKSALHQWLFDQNLGYTRVLQLVYEHFGIQPSKSSLSRYYQALARRQLREDLRETDATVAVAAASDLNKSSLRSATVNLVGKRLIDATLQHGGAKPGELTSLASVVLVSEQQDIQRGWLDLAREKFRFNAVETARKLVPTLNEMTEEDQEREQWQRHHMMRAAFGEHCDHIQLPEGEGPSIGSKQWAELHKHSKFAPQSAQAPQTSSQSAQKPEIPDNPA